MKIRGIGSVWALFFLLGFLGSAFGQPHPAERAKVTAPGGLEALAAKIVKKGSVRLIVRVDASFQPVADPASDAALRQAGRIRAVQDVVQSQIAAFNVRQIHKYRHIPYMFMEVDEQALHEVLASPQVVDVQEDVPEPAMLNLSVPRIGAPAVWNSGYKGAGVSVAVLDTGVDKNHSSLAGSVVSEACYSSNYAPGFASSVCPGGVTESVAAGSAMPYGGNCPAEECDHGTHVSGIIAGRQNVSGSPGPGVAPEASIIAIQVFTRFDDGQDCDPNPAPCALTYTSDQLKGLERVYALRSVHTIAAVNMSLGGGQYSSNCDINPRKAIIDNLKAAGIATVASSGNKGYCGEIGSPACISSVVSVGATTDLDGVASYSNSAPFMSLFAPGSSINSSIPGGNYQSWNGTSMAAPHVSGAWALLKQAAPARSVADVLDALRSTGPSITDSKCGTVTVTKKRINVNEALSLLTVEPQPPAVTTNAATSITSGGATLNGTVNANNASTTATFEYGTTVSYGSTVTATPSPVAGSTPTAVSAGLTGLTPNTLYHYRAKGVSSVGTSNGGDMTFTTADGGACANIGDGSFEAGTPNSSWTETSTNFGTPLCDSGSCGDGGGTAGPRTGNWWAWFGGISGAAETASLTQNVTIPSGSAPTLEFYLWIGASSGNGTDFLKVKMDGTEIFSVLEGNAAYTSGYTLVSVSLSGYADGGNHIFSVESTTTSPGGNVTNFNVDDVSIVCNPSSPSISGRVTNSGSAGIGNAKVKIFDAGQNLILKGVTDAGGNYAVAGLPGGSYKVQFNGCSSGYQSEWYSDKGGFNTADAVSITSPVVIDSVLSGYTAPFNDMPAGLEGFIGKLACNGITGGCSATSFCPNNNVTRAQMAVFITTALDEKPAAACTGMLNDVNAGTVGDTFCRFIEKFATLGITGGCGGGNYCPNDNVTRAQMAVFITTALGEAPAASCTGMFSDVSAGTVGEVFCKYIEKFATLGITAGCGGGKYCPNDPVTRAQMAVFLTTGFLQ